MVRGIKLNRRFFLGHGNKKDSGDLEQPRALAVNLTAEFPQDISNQIRHMRLPMCHASSIHEVLTEE